MDVRDTVILESPFAGDVEANTAYARRAMYASLTGAGEAPMVSHLLYTQVLDDAIPAEREIGIKAGLAWRAAARRSVVYIDRGVSTGMLYGVAAAMGSGVVREYRSIDGLAEEDILRVGDEAETAALDKLAHAAGGFRDTVILESPFAGDIEANTAYARLAMHHSLTVAGEAPMVSHLLYTQVLDDSIPAEREVGIKAGLAWRHAAMRSVVYVDRGVSGGMLYGIAAAMDAEVPRLYRSIEGLDDEALLRVQAEAETRAAALCRKTVPAAAVRVA